MTKPAGKGGGERGPMGGSGSREETRANGMLSSGGWGPGQPQVEGQGRAQHPFLCVGAGVSLLFQAKESHFPFFQKTGCFFKNGEKHSPLVEFGRMGGFNGTKESRDKVSFHQLCAHHCVFQ